MTLEEVRVGIDRVDREIKGLFQERMDLADQVAQVKAATGDRILKPEREQAIISRLTGDVHPGIRKEYTAFLKKFMQISRKYQYGRTLELRHCFDISWKEGTGDLKKTAVVLPKDQAYGFVPGENEFSVISLDEAGRMIRDGQADSGRVMLEGPGSVKTEELDAMLARHQLFVNRQEIRDIQGSCCRTLLFTDQLTVTPEDNRLKILFACPDRSGSLAGILSMIADYTINITEIHSLPEADRCGDPAFCAELECNLRSKEMQAMVFQLENETSAFRILGSYFCGDQFSK